MEAQRIVAQRRHHHPLRRQAEVAAHFVGDECRIGENPLRALDATPHQALDFRQAVVRLARREVHMGEVMQGHDHGSVELQRPQARLVVQVDRPPAQAGIEAPLLQPAADPVGTRHPLGRGGPA
ncbi:hypothetical protein D3C81_1726960 [compost metagenome]